MINLVQFTLWLNFIIILFLDNFHSTSQIFELIHCDLWRPSSTIFHDGSKFFLTIVDNFSKTTWFYLLRTKAETRQCIESFYNLIETQFSTKIKILRSDNSVDFQTNFFLITRASSITKLVLKLETP